MNIILNQARACAFLLAVLATGANAASITLVGSPSVGSGSTFDIQMFGNFDGDGLFGGGSLVGWDAGLVTLDNVALNLAGLDAGLSCPGAPFCAPVSSNPTQVGFSPSGGFLLADGAGSTLMATLTFTAIADGSAAFTIADDLATFGGYANLVGAPISVANIGTSVTIGTAVVPVPAAVWLFGSGLLGLVGVARRRTAA